MPGKGGDAGLLGGRTTLVDESVVELDPGLAIRVAVGGQGVVRHDHLGRVAVGTNQHEPLPLLLRLGDLLHVQREVGKTGLEHAGAHLVGEGARVDQPPLVLPQLVVSPGENLQAEVQVEQEGDEPHQQDRQRKLVNAHAAAAQRDDLGIR